MILRNKKADEKLLFPMLVISWIILMTGIAIGVTAIYGAVFDVRGMEANILSYNLMDCIAPGGIVIDNFMDKNFDIIQQCSFYKSSVSDSGLFYFSVRLIDSSSNLEMKSLSLGDPDLKMQCDYKSTEKQLAVCFYKNISVAYLNSSGGREKAVLKIITASNNVGVKV